MDKVRKDLNDIERKLGKCNKIVEKGDKISFGDAIKLGRKSNSIVSTIKKTIKDYDGTNPTEDEHNKIQSQMNDIVDLSEKQLSLLVQNKAQFERLHVGGLVKRNMGKSDEASKELEKLMLAKSPADLKPQAEALAKRRTVAFEKSRAEFVQSVGGEDQADGDGEDDSD